MICGFRAEGSKFAKLEDKDVRADKDLRYQLEGPETKVIHNKAVVPLLQVRGGPLRKDVYEHVYVPAQVCEGVCGLLP